MKKKLCLFFLLIFIVSLFIHPNLVVANSEEEIMLVDTLYSKDLIIADVIVDPLVYDVDPTGLSDSTLGINQAIEDCYSLGGGTVFLPSGKYRVSGNITVLPFVTLHGDYNDPDDFDFNGDYGTLIYADVESNEENFPALITVGGSAGAVGLTIYYPYQSVENVIPYGYTFEIPSFASQRGHADHMAPTIKDVTMINSYKGVSASITTSGSLISAANEMIHLENIKGTVLYKGFELYNSSEYGVIKDITINNSYWTSAASYLSSPDIEDINAFTMAYGTGMQVGDLEWVVFSNILIQNYHTGLRIYDGLRRFIAGQPEIYFIGQFYHLEIYDTVIALRVDNLYPNFGINIAQSYLNGQEYAVYREDETNSVINLVGTELVGNVSGEHIIESGANQTYLSEGYQDSYDQSLDLSSIPRVLYNVIDYYADISGQYDSSLAIQNALDDAHANGGGIVYMPAGYYKLSNSINIYDNTMLRGSSGINHRDEIGLSLGTVILSGYGYTFEQEVAENGQALITIVGDNAGVEGVRIHYPLNIPDFYDGTIRLHTYTIRGLGDYNFVAHVSLAGSAYGIEMLGAEDDYLESPYIIGVNGTYYRKGIRLAYVENAYLDELLSNGTVVSRQGLDSIFPQYYTSAWPSDGNGGLAGVYDHITRPNSIYISVVSSSDVFVKSSFTFASNTFLVSMDSSVFLINNAGDNLYHSGYLIRAERSDVTAINMMRYSGTSLQLSNSNVTIFNRLSLLDHQEKDLVNSIEIADISIASTSNTKGELPDDYQYDASKDVEIPYPIEASNPEPEPVDDEPSTHQSIYYYIGGALVLLLTLGIIIIIKKR